MNKHINFSKPLYIKNTMVVLTGLTIKTFADDEQFIIGYVGNANNKLKVSFISFEKFANNPIITNKRFIEYDSLLQIDQEYFDTILIKYLKKTKYSDFIYDAALAKIYKQSDVEFILKYFYAYYLDGNNKLLDKFNNIGSDWQTKFSNFIDFEIEYEKLYLSLETNPKFKTAINLAAKSGNVADGIKFLKSKKYNIIKDY
jgi:hypothetical protein